MLKKKHNLRKLHKFRKRTEFNIQIVKFAALNDLCDLDVCKFKVTGGSLLI